MIAAWMLARENAMKNRPLLFLDFDGVLNSARYFRDRFDGADPDGIDADQAQIDPESVALLNQILRATGAVIVISSSWRLIHTLAELDTLLRARGLDPSAEIIGATPDLYTRPRGEEIQAWLDDCAEWICWRMPFCILDDDCDMAHLSGFHVHVPMQDGLTEAHVSRAIAMLDGAR